MVEEKKTFSGLDPKIAGVLCWIFAPASSIIFLLIEKEDRFVKFHAMESLYWSIAGIVIGIIISIIGTMTVVLLCVSPIWWLFYYGVSIFVAVKAYKGEEFKLPLIGDMVKV